MIFNTKPTDSKFDPEFPQQYTLPASPQPSVIPWSSHQREISTSLNSAANKAEGVMIVADTSISLAAIPSFRFAGKDVTGLKMPGIGVAELSGANATADLSDLRDSRIIFAKLKSASLIQARLTRTNAIATNAPPSGSAVDAPVGVLVRAKI